jgi:hypothetical protein
MKIEDKLGKFLTEEVIKEEYDEWTDEENEAKETMKELAKLFGGRFTGDGVTLYPFKKGDEWEIYAIIESYDPFEYNVLVSFHNDGTNMDGELSFYTEELTEKMVRDIGKLQKLYYDTVETVKKGIGKMGDLDI